MTSVRGTECSAASPPGARIAGVACHLPPVRVSTEQVEQRLADQGRDGWRPRGGFLERLTGIRYRHVADPQDDASDLAIRASAKLLAQQGVTPDEVDLMVFASASQDMVEPATAHIVAAGLGLTCPAFDVKDACNSFLQGIGVAEALIRTGRHRRVLVATGETPTRAARWVVGDDEQFLTALPGYTLSDSGAAMLLEPSAPATGDSATGGSVARIELLRFGADSSQWQVGTLPGGGSAHGCDPEAAFFRADVRRMKEAFAALGPDLFVAALADLGLGWNDFDVVAVHQVALGHLASVLDRCGVDPAVVPVVVAEHGNLASAGLPVQLAFAIESGRCGPGDRIALLGLAGGLSLGILVATL